MLVFEIAHCVSAQQRLARRRSESPAPSKLLLTPDISRHPSNSSLENEPLEDDRDSNEEIKTIDHEDEDINVED